MEESYVGGVVAVGVVFVWATAVVGEVFEVLGHGDGDAEAWHVGCVGVVGDVEGLGEEYLPEVVDGVGEGEVYGYFGGVGGSGSGGVGAEVGVGVGSDVVEVVLCGDG